MEVKALIGGPRHWPVAGRGRPRQGLMNEGSQVMTKVLVSPDNPDGWKLEDILDEIQNDIIRRTARIVDDHRPEARAVLHNNIEIMQLLTTCSDKAHESTRILNSLGPSVSPQGGVPRIGRHK